MDTVEPARVSVVLVDDQEPFRGAARVVLGRTDGFELVGEAQSGEQAVELVDDLGPSMVLMDINMPGMGGIEATRRIVDAHPETMVVLVSTYQASDLPTEAQTSGALAYLNKEDLTPRVLRRLWEERGNGSWPAP